jgi:hypothetical protein
MFQAHGLVGFAFFVDEKREVDSGFVAEEAGILGVSQADHGDACAFFLEGCFRCAQLRDMLSAEDSTIMPQKHDHRRPLFPQRTQPRGLAFRVRERDVGELAAIGFGHAGHSLGWCWPCQEKSIGRRFALPRMNHGLSEGMNTDGMDLTERGIHSPSRVVILRSVRSKRFLQLASRTEEPCAHLHWKKPKSKVACHWQFPLYLDLTYGADE